VKHNIALAILLGLILISNHPAYPQNRADTDKLKQEIEALKANQTAIQKDIAEIKNLLTLQAKQAAAAVPAQPSGPTTDNPVTVKLDGGITRGNKDAKVTLVEFTDYQCPFCSRHFRDTLPQIDKEYVKTGKVRYILREFPLESIHPMALKAAEAANCSGQQGKYWEMHDRLFTNQNALSTDQLPIHAGAIGLDVTKFKNCLDSGTYTAKIRSDLSEAQKLGVNGTPTFFVGFSDPTSAEIKAVKMIVGAQNYGAFKSVLDSLLVEQ
jgi:protein-disulfide isomerase